MALRDEDRSGDRAREMARRTHECSRSPSHPRHQMLGGLLFQAQKNATAVRVLLSFEHPLYGSAAALVRPIFEMYVRALWVREVAHR